jgi:hypothetical protein
MDTSLLILLIMTAVYAAALALMSLPFREFKVWGHAYILIRWYINGITHSIALES